jgi:nucleoside-diphosphate-sugar epimerase
VNGFVAVGDVARAVEMLLGTEASGQRYILSGDNWSYRQVFDAAAKGFGKKQPSREATPFLSGIAWRLERLKTVFSGRPTLLTRESARVAQRNTRYDSGKLLRKLPGFRFTPLQEAIETACKGYLEHMQQIPA